MAHLTPTERRIIETLERIGGGVVLPELAYQTGMNPIDLMANMDSLLRRREVYPWAYTTPTAAGKLLAMAGTSPTLIDAQGTSRGGNSRKSPLACKGRNDAVTIGGPHAHVEGKGL